VTDRLKIPWAVGAPLTSPSRRLFLSPVGLMRLSPASTVPSEPVAVPSPSAVASTEMWEQEGLSCAGSRLCGDIKEELGAHHMWPSLSDVQDNAVKGRFTRLF
jgi:hypothetical protein